MLTAGGAASDVIVKGSAANLYNYDGGEGSPSTGDDGLQIPNGNSLKHVIFCYDVVLDPQISGTKFDDANASGTADAGEAGIPGCVQQHVGPLSLRVEGCDISPDFRAVRFKRLATGNSCY